MTQEQVISKIKKLLELASSPNENEAKLAMEKAQRLMQEYCIENTLLNEEERRIEVREYSAPFSFPGLAEFIPTICFTISSLFGGYVLVKGKTPLIYAYPTNQVVIKHAVDCILNQGREDCVKEFAKTRSLAFLPSFWAGFNEGLANKFKPLAPEKGIEIWDAAKAAAQKNAKGSYNIGSYGYSAGLNAGKSSGENATIRPGVNPQFGGYLK